MYIFLRPINVFLSLFAGGDVEGGEGGGGGAATAHEYARQGGDLFRAIDINMTLMKKWQLLM